MRTDGNYVQVKVSLEEKERFLHIANRCKFTEKLTLYKMLHDDELREHPPEDTQANQENRRQHASSAQNRKIRACIKGFFWRYREFEQYLQIVRRDMVFICSFGTDPSEEG